MVPSRVWLQSSPYTSDQALRNSHTSMRPAEGKGAGFILQQFKRFSAETSAAYWQQRIFEQSTEAAILNEKRKGKLSCPPS